MSDIPANAVEMRDELLDRAQRGEISGAEADAEAIRFGLGSLSSRPPSVEYRPEELPYWTLPMVVAWIISLDLDTVREWHAPYVAECWRWVHRQWRVGRDGPIHEGWLLEQPPPPTLSLLGISVSVDAVEGDGPRPTMSFDEAQESLWIMLREGFVKASGIDLETGRRRDIPALEWQDLVPVEGHGQVDEVRHGLQGEGYRDVLLASEAVRSSWRKKLPLSGELPELMPPTGHGYMPLYCAAQWIGTEGGQVPFDLWDEGRWRIAFDDLLAAISSEKVRVTGLRGGLRETVPAAVFAGLRVFYPSGNEEESFLGNGEAYLQSWPYIDDEHWRGGFDDRITNRHEPQWTALMVEKGDVRTLWPFGEPPPRRSGAPGRPSSADLFKAEMERRAAQGELASSLNAEAKYLSDWLARKHITEPQAKPDDIRASIRSRYWELRGKK